MSGGPTKIFINIEPDAEKQEVIKNSRKTLKVIQIAADKENLIGRQNTYGTKEKLMKSDHNETHEIKRKKVISQSSQTEEKVEKTITADDLTTDDNPSETYWEVLAEKRRIALEDTLGENQKLHEKVESLEDELNTSRKMLDETRNLVAVLTEMLRENEEDNTSISDDENER